jgi:hypothetical protein
MVETAEKAAAASLHSSPRSFSPVEETHRFVLRENKKSCEEEQQEIRNASTFDSSSVDDDDCKNRSFSTATDAVSVLQVLEEKPSAIREEEGYDEEAGDSKRKTADNMVLSSWKDMLPHIFYISVFSVFGAVLRVFMGRFFGWDCDQRENNAVEAYSTPMSSSICVTATGKTEQTGGALFIDLPANMLGS